MSASTKLWNACLDVGTQFELLFEEEMLSIPGCNTVYKASHKEALYDFLVVINGIESRCELKSIAGAARGTVYNTFCIEVIANDGRGKTAGVRPGWWIATESNELDYVVVLNRYEKKMYTYDAKVLLSYVKEKLSVNAKTSRASNGGTGSVIMVPWTSKQAGLVSIRDMSHAL